MTYVPVVATSTVAVAAAAEAARRMREEEEEMTAYSKEDLDGWEFKIVRANSQKFKDYTAVQRLCEEESRAGWEMVEKFDNSRIRFKRRIERRSGDRQLQIDPYRTLVGIGQGALVASILGATFLATGLVILAIFIAKG